MSKIAILGAAGQIARLAIQQFLAETSSELTLFLRNSGRVNDLANDRVRAVEGDVMDTAALENAVRKHDVVYANLGGDNIEDQAKSLVAALDAVGVRRLIWIATSASTTRSRGHSASGITSSSMTIILGRKAQLPNSLNHRTLTIRSYVRHG